MKWQPLRIGAASVIAATMIGSGLAAPKADAASGESIQINMQSINDKTFHTIAQKYGIDLSKLNFTFNGITITFPSKPTATPAPTAKPTATPAPTAKPTATPAPTAKPTATPAPTAKPTATPAPTAKPTATPAPAASALQQEIVTLVNQERAKVGLPGLQMDELLNKVAMEKARDMDVNNYFSHTSPTYGSPFDMMKAFGVKYNYAGENIASGQPTAARVMSDWMNSPGHRANIVNANFTKIGVGYVNGEWVQMFIG
ncbi:CAP domain-containing protein [Paenibacillus sp. PL2-23]|uniref:CAP domain-containing protein n=1 Tax=Paenibacillus sp. PL2-23 TaxID=2100729 RepID=UPI0030FA2CF3